MRRASGDDQQPQPPIQDEYIEKYLSEGKLDLTTTLDAKETYSYATLL